MITRFDRAVHTQQLKDIDLLETDFSEVDVGMDKCNKFAHDAPIDNALSVPEPDEIKKKKKKLDDWIKSIKDRRK